MRIQKLLSQQGVASRRTVEAWIKAGRILVNGKLPELGLKVTTQDEIQLDGKLIALTDGPAFHQTLIYHKPVGEICSRSDPEGRPTVFDRLPEPAHGQWISIGRLDLNTSGLLIFTTDGEFANRMMHPSSELQREYKVRVYGTVTSEILNKLKKGIKLEDGHAAFDQIERMGTKQGKNTWYRVILSEGRNRIVRRLWEAVGCQVSQLTRIRFGEFELPKIQPGDYLVK